MNTVKTLKTAIWVDVAGSMSETPEQQVERLKEFYSTELGVNLAVHLPRHVSEIEPGTELVLFDYGGMSYGNSLMEDCSRAVVQWAKDHPNAVVVVVSTFTYNRAVKYEVEELQERDGTKLHNLVVEDYRSSLNDDVMSQFLPDWFLAHARKGEEIKQDAPKTLPCLKFLLPSKKFLDFMAKRFAGKVVYDVGAGVGHVAAALKETGKFKDVFALDVFLRDTTEYPVYRCDSRWFPFPAGCVVMFCRPCHGPFVEETIEHALSRGVTKIVYVGLRKNVRGDLGDFYKRFRRIKEGAGQEREAVWMMQPKKKKGSTR